MLPSLLLSPRCAKLLLAYTIETKALNMRGQNGTECAAHEENGINDWSSNR